MLFSFGIMIIFAILLGEIAQRLHLPRLFGMLVAGILLGNTSILDSSLLSISSDLRQIALIIILTRAGLNLDLESLKKSGISALLLCFLPACLEIIGITICSMYFLKFSWIEGAIIGSVLAAVSPAVIVPKMLKIQQEEYGNNKGIGQMIMAAASVDDIFVIVVFNAFLTLGQKQDLSYLSFINIPVSILLGILVGILCGYLFVYFFNSEEDKTNTKPLILLSISFILVTFEKSMTSITFSAMLAIMSMGATIKIRNYSLATSLASKYTQLWSAAEVWLFALVGACLKIEYILQGSLLYVLVLFIGLLFRSIGTLVSVSFGNLNKHEKLFCIYSYLPKATVQAAIGSLPLAYGLPVGETSLSIAVLAILITAPIGAMLIENNYTKLLTQK